MSEPEKAIIGCILLDPVTCYHEAVKYRLNENWFMDLHCRIAWRIIASMDRERVTNLSVSEESIKRETPIDVLFLNDCMESAPIAAYIGHWLNALRREHLRRLIKRAGTEATSVADDPDTDPDDLIARLQASLHSASGEVESEKSTLDVYNEIVGNWQAARTSKGSGLPTSIPDLSTLLGGYRPGKVYVLASRPGGGKSTFMGQEAFNLASAGHPVSIASIEMSEHELRGRILASSAGLSSFGLDTGFYHDTDFDSVAKLGSDHAAIPIRINDRYLTIERFCAWAQYEKSKYNTEFFAVDYLQLLSSKVHKHESRNAEVSEMMNRLCELAKTLNVPLLVLSQLSRTMAHEKRHPDLHDLRDSGSIEQGAYAVLFLHHEKDEESGTEDSKIILAKNRGGPAGHVPIFFERNRQRFTGR